MPVLDSKLRSQLDDVCQKARDLAEGAARSALQKRAVDVAEPFSHFGPKEKELRNRLRARGRQVGDFRNADKSQSIDQLTQELAYEFWHRMLFARFLAENHLLMHPDGVAVSLEECDELAKDAEPPAPNGFVLAARYASTMLPQIFRTDDVLLEIDFAPEQRLALEKLLSSLPQKTFIADDSLGWVYQFWQSKKKDEVNKTGDKIDGRTLSAVTQLFTEHYMVQFLLHNTIGALWCGRHGIKGTPGGAGVPAGKSPVEMEYLRWRDDGTPAAGTFDGWPKTLAEFTMLDPCCGSGHFLVAAFNLLVPLRMHDEKLKAEQACEAVLRDNLFGLELDPRCTQIAAFALALAAWKYPDSGGYRPLPPLNIACSGQCVTDKKEEWLAIANGDDKLRNGMDRLYELFQQAHHLGSLIDPRREKGDLYQAGYADLQPLLAKALIKKAEDADLSAFGVAAQGITRAAEMLVGRYTLVMTNVPYLGKGKQGDVIKEYLEDHYAAGKADLATAFILRCLDFCCPGGSTALVTPQNWLFLASYTKVREKLLKERTWNCLALLGEEAWWSFGIRGPRTVLHVLTANKPDAGSEFFGIDVSTNRGETPILFDEKADRLANRVLTSFQLVGQAKQLQNPDAKVILTELMNGTRLGDIAVVSEGLHTGDYPRFGRKHWEFALPREGWSRQQGGTGDEDGDGGCEHVIFWQDGKGELIEFVQERLGGQSTSMWIKGEEVWGKRGVTVGTMNELNHAHYTGALFTHGVVAVVANVDSNLPAIWCYISSDQFRRDVRQLDQKVSVARASIENVQLDLAHWQAVGSEKYQNGLPAPDSNDPAQWLFKGNISTSIDPLQVAVARLLGYRWPEQPTTKDAIDKLADRDGILCLPGVRGEAAAAERLLEVLHEAYGKNWSDSVLHTLLTDAGCKAGTTLDDWLRNQFFDQHSKRFHSRPFIWHIWDGRKDGFSALVNYHKLDHKALENLTYSYLGDWITAQGKSDKAGADSRLGAAQALQAKLKLILAGESPYDIFVRWKPLHEQAIGWHPELNDGVRMNIRPFIEADILRKNPNIKWTKDRGNEPERDKADYPWFWNGNDPVGDRVNDVHLTNENKTSARSRKKGAK